MTVLPANAPPTGRSPSWSRRLSLAWDKASIYLPVLVMALLAAASYWIVRQTPTWHDEAPVAAPASTEPDYRMLGFTVRSFDAAGRFQSELRGREMRHFPATGEVEVDQAEVERIDEAGHRTRARAVELWTNANQTVYRLKGNVVVTRETPEKVELRGEALTVYPEDERVVSEEPVTILRGRDTLSAQTLQYDLREGVAVLTGQVRATLQARPTGR